VSQKTYRDAAEQSISGRDNLDTVCADTVNTGRGDLFRHGPFFCAEGKRWNGEGGLLNEAAESSEEGKYHEDEVSKGCAEHSFNHSLGCYGRWLIADDRIS